MAKLNVSPTKSNLQRLKRDLGFAQEGYEMLEQKRQILVLELIGMVEAAKRAQEEVREKMGAAYKVLREAQIRRGTARLKADATAPRPAHAANVSSRALMGITLPTVTTEHPPLRPTTSLLIDSPVVDTVTVVFRAALESVDKLAEIENSVFRLAREVRKTQRRVNALEKIFIPTYRETIGFILSVLEERERDEFVVMRMVKERLAKAH